MKRWSSLFLVAACLLGVSFLSAGCASEESPPAEKPAEAPPTPRVPEALQKALVEVVSLAPADAIAVGTFRSPESMVGEVNAFAGPELSALMVVPISFLPPGVFDMKGPVGWTVFMSEGGPAFVFVMRARPGAVLEGEDAGEGLTKLVLPALDDAPFYCARDKDWIAFSGKPAFVQTFRAAKARLKVDEATAVRIGQALVWTRLNMEFLAAMAKGGIEQQRAQIRKRQDPDSANKTALFDWLEDLVEQLQAVELACDMNGDAMTSRLRFVFKDNAALLDIARALEPIGTYEEMLPASDRLLAASWVNINWNEMTPRAKAFLQVPVDAALKQLDQMAGHAPAGSMPEGFQPPPGPPFAAFGKALREMWKLADDYQHALAGRHASLAEVPRPGEGVIWQTETHALKDTAAFQVLVDKAVAVASDFVGAIFKSVPTETGGPAPDIAFEQVKNAETIEGVSIDQLRFHVGFTVPENAPPRVAQQAKQMDDVMKAIYGPDGLTFRVAIVENRALVALGGPEVMARAIRRARGEVEDLAKQAVVTEAIRRLPKNARLALVVSGPAYFYLYGRMYETVLGAMCPPEVKESLEDVPQPPFQFPLAGDLTTAALVIEDNTVELSMHVPGSEVERSIPVIRQAIGRLMLQGVHMGLGVARGFMPPPGNMEEPWQPDEDFFDEPMPEPEPGVPENLPTEAQPEPAPAPPTE